MNAQTDQQLLRDYAGSHSEAAFAELVRRHIDLVYSAALRMVCDSHLAEDVTQGVFVALSQNARQLTHHPVLSGWLHRTTQNLAANAVRTNVRRQLREQEVLAMNELLSTGSDTNWEHIAPHLDAALGELSEPDRDALLLRYFERKSAREMSQTLGISDEAAQKRVTRAVERLREFFAKRGVTVGASGLVVLISANAVQSAPVGLSVTVWTTTVFAGKTLATTATASAIKTIAMTALQKTLITAVVTVVAGAGIYEARQASQMRGQVQMLQQQQRPLVAQIQQLQQERDAATQRLASIADSAWNNDELLKLRNEVTTLRHSQTASQGSAKVPSQTGITRDDGPSLAAAGRDLGMAVIRGEANAFDKLVAESNAEHQSFNTNNVGLNDAQREELSSRTFIPINAAFKVIGDAAGKGNQWALDALTHALETPELKGLAVDSIGGLARNGDGAALEILLHPQKYGVLLSSTIPALQPAADNGNQEAIDALAAIAKNQTDWPLWLMTANSLAKAAAAGNAVAIDSLIGMSSSTNQNIQNAAVRALKGAAANQNPKATEALRAMGTP